ncbi:MAG: extracellular solute-binding protein [Patescibacteria group bacterium]|nr:extracellular solute-binding protein [Patescibacteria group bacterium]
MAARMLWKKLGAFRRFLLLIAVIFPLAGFRCTLMPQSVRQLLQPVTLNYWRVWDSPGDFSDIIAAYQSVHPNITINIRTLRYEEFADQLLRAYAHGTAPDLMSLNVSWLRYYALREGFIQPMPGSVTMAYQRTQRSLGIKEETIVEQRTQPTLTLGNLQSQYLDTVVRDVVFGGKIWGLPLSVDTLVLFYNRELFNAAGIPLPPASWEEFQSDVTKLTYRDAKGNILQSGVALGTGNNVRRGLDVLALLMLQNGTAIMAPNGAVQFHIGPQGKDVYHPGVEALRFYTDYANPTKQVYSWNATRPDSITAFASNQAAMTFGYSFDLAEIKAASKGRLNYGIVPVPQLAGANVNVASYWVETVSSRTAHPNESWDFILFAARAENVRGYLSKTGKPTALRALVSEQIGTDALNPFATQLLTARSWYYGYDAATAESALRQLIDNVLGGAEPLQAEQLAARQIEQTAR